MFREMTLGQYYNVDSVLHRLDARVKLMGTLVFLITLFTLGGFIGLIFATVALGSVVILSKVPLKMYIRGVKPLMPIFLFTVIIHLFFTQGTVILSFGFLHITKEGCLKAVYIFIRLVYLIVGTSVMTFTTTPNQLMDGLEKAFHFLTYIKVPVHELAMMMSIALRFIPIMTEELDKIMKAQMSRGADFESGNLIERAKKLVPILVPLLISAIRRATDLANAMDARCYHGGEGRTRLHPLQYRQADIVGYLVEAVYLILIIVLARVIL